MKIGFFTSTFSDRAVEEVLDFAASAKFDAVEFDARSHIKTPDAVAKVVAQARDRGLAVSSIALTGNQLEPDDARRAELRNETLRFAEAVGAAGVSIFIIFPGRDVSAAEDHNYKAFADHANALLDATSRTRLSIAIENWPGPRNDYILVTPEGWRKAFALIPDARFGLEFDPSHLLRLGIDPFAALEGVKDRIKILHAKDTSIDRVRLQAVGYYGAGWWRYRLPGFGMLDWARFLTQARGHGFDGVISIEHEDADFGWPRRDLDARLDGERQGLAFLQRTLAQAGL
jgi:sugar phosphate isomerase/epimerase